MPDEPLTTEIRIAVSAKLAAILDELGLLARCVTPTHPELAGEIANVAAQTEKLRRMVVG